ncbi:MAG: DUF1587 domain-containing protein [Chthoniobacter sp.]
MPPKKKTQPKPEEAQAFVASLGGDLRTFDSAREASRGRTVLRRLNRVEYEQTVQDLLGIKTPLAAILPADTPSQGFDTVAEGLRLSMLQMEKYLEAADVALDAAINLGPQPERKSARWVAREDKDIRKNLDTPVGQLSNPKDPKSGHHVLLLELPDAVVYFDRGYPSAKVETGGHPAGLFKLRISAYGYQSGGKAIPMRVYRDNYREKQLIGWYDMTPDQPRVVEVTAQLSANEHIRIEPSNTGIDERGQNVYNIGPKELKAPGLALMWVEMEGPHRRGLAAGQPAQSLWRYPVAKIDEKKNHDKKIAYELTPEDSKAAARQALESFAARAFRRPLEPGEAIASSSSRPMSSIAASSSSRRCEWGCGPSSPRRNSCSSRNTRENSTITPSPRACPISCGARCRMMNCSAWPPITRFPSRRCSMRKSSAC